MGKITREVRAYALVMLASTEGFVDLPEQRKAALRRVELELDEADDIVRTLLNPTTTVTHL